jgi:hypothetical protein
VYGEWQSKTANNRSLRIDGVFFGVNIIDFYYFNVF